MSKIFSIVAAFIITIGTIGGGLYAVEGYFAKETETIVSFDEVRADMVMISNRIDSMRLEDQLLIVEKKIARMESRWGEVFYERFNRYWQTREELRGVMPDDYKEEYDRAFKEKKRLEEAIMEKNKKKRESD